MKMNLPNKLTMIRVILIPFFVVFLLYPMVDYSNYIATGIFIVASLTDLADGKIARRTFYNNTSVLLLDEITEGIDPESEREVLEALKRMAERGKMIICVSHKKELLEAAGQVIYMKEGTVINVTSHQYLIENDADYRELLGGGNEW